MKFLLPFTLSALSALPTLLLAGAAQAQVTVQDAWVRATVPRQQATGAFMRLQSDSGARLVAASSPLTPNVEIHEMTMEGEVMRMRQVSAIALPPRQPVDLKPGGYHIMLLKLKRQVRAGDSVPLTLVFEHRDGRPEPVTLMVPVRALNAASGHGQR